uniref:NADH-ubiquinone oxidoreductase chain 5 n=1 Tax=Ectomomyrmex javanus TaxID=2571052 RepID=A0A4D6P0S0_9HYME|nr:NADH dehydrogenase subunit 5 [Ectomomyrmex javanus]QCE31829.1 NADH dehydrogenase subunit 5 [Ectomomyrmex javanus]
MIYMYIYFMILLSLYMFIMSMYLFYYDMSLIMEWLVFSINSMNMEFLMYMDWISMLFISFVLLISSMVMLYSVIYMNGDKNINRFNLLVILFILSMLMMIISPNIISIMIGWDGLGLVSYCLVIYYQNYSSYNSGMLTVLMNRVGDIMILMLISMMFIYGSWNKFMMKEIYFMIMLILIAGMTKSAQIPFSSWLPSAMAAPTPVSALVHSSTLVTAGVYLLIRFSNMLMNTGINKWLLMLSMMTMFMSGLMANFEYDLKKIIALSTLSQLGLMMIILSIGFPMMSFYHLLVHAIFKSLLFLGAGIIIHLMMNNQDIRMLGGLNSLIPFTMISFYLSLMSLCGFPFMSGFYSKDLIMEIIYMSKFNMMMFILSLISLMFTVMYSFRLMYYMFFGEMKYYSLNLIYENKLMNLSMMMLMFLSVIIGSMLNWMFFIESIFLSMKLKFLTLLMLMLGLMLIYNLMNLNLLKMYYLSYFFSSMWFMNYLFIYMNKLILKNSSVLYNFDKIWMEFYSKMFFLNLFKEYMNYQMNYKYKIYMFLNWMMIYLILIMIMF